MTSGPTEPAPPSPAAVLGTGFDGDLGWALGVLFRAYAKAAGAALGDLPSGPRGYQVLAAAAQDVAANQGWLASHLGIDRTVLTYLIDDLENQGLVERRPDPTDRRNRRVVATDKGRELCRERREVLRHVETHLLDPLGPADADAFRALLQRLAAQANERDPIVSPCEAVEHLDLAQPAPRRPRRT